jgi:hypothetical protein
MRAWAQGHPRTRRARPAWPHELALVAAAYVAYTMTRNTLPAHRARAEANALALYRCEKTLHLDVERTLNDIVAGHGINRLSVLANYTYSLAHVCVTLGVLVWVYVARSGAYRTARTTLLVTTLLGLLSFWLYPLAPPRFFPRLGFVDTVVRDDTWGSWGSNAFAEASNQYAAMPSIHVAWAIWAAATVAILARSRWVEAGALLYPFVVVLVILGTANHWTLDAVAGAAVVAVGAGTAALVSQGRPLPRLSPACGGCGVWGSNPRPRERAPLLQRRQRRRGSTPTL